MNEDQKHLRDAVKQARLSKSEDDRPHPKVGVVVVSSDGKVTKAYRGERGKGDHAEFTVMEKKLEGQKLAGATVYTTLEPCTTRNHPKISCAARLVERRVRRVVIGMLDPNPNILGRGVLQLREAGIEVELFPHPLMAELEELNRSFRRAHPMPPAITENLLAELQRRSLDDWYVSVNSIYWNRNFQRDPSSIFTHLMEVVGALSVLVSKKHSAEPDHVAPLIAKSIAWWLALCGQIGVASVKDMLWSKFPYVCAYCEKKPCLGDGCTRLKEKRMKDEKKGPEWPDLKRRGTKNKRSQPKSIAEWQQMFASIYPSTSTEDFPHTFAKLSEEMGELAEAVRVFSAEPGYFLSEAADVFAWLMKLINLSERPLEHIEKGEKLQELMSESYPARCRDCNDAVCSCPPILQSTIGRIAHEVPANFISFEEGGSYLTAEGRSEKFGKLK